MATLPNVDAEQIKIAFTSFDTNLRELPEWADWESKAIQYFVVEFGGKNYPPKKILSLATGAPLTEFSGGIQSNSYLTKLGFRVLRIKAAREAVPAPTFEIGRVYDRKRDINIPFGGSYQSGISASTRTPAIFLFTGGSGQQFGYEDHFNTEGVFCYTGEGQIGDMKLDKGNRAIANHATEGRALHVFQALGKGKGQKYMGEFSSPSHKFGKGKDKNNEQRRIIVFHLVPVGRLPDILVDPLAVDSNVGGISLEDARKRALAACESQVVPETSQALRSLYMRCSAVRTYVLMRSNGNCESCGKQAPFNRSDGTPYLEPHHTTRVSDGGLDHPKYVGAVCPNCHREIHSGINGTARNAELIEYLTSIESNV